MDSLHILLETKEMHLFKMMKAIQYWKIDSLQNNEFKQTVKMKTITRKKESPDYFGKENILIPCYTFNKNYFLQKIAGQSYGSLFRQFVYAKPIIKP